MGIVEVAANHLTRNTVYGSLFWRIVETGKCEMSHAFASNDCQFTVCWLYLCSYLCTIGHVWVVAAFFYRVCIAVGIVSFHHNCLSVGKCYRHCPRLFAVGGNGCCCGIGACRKSAV